MKILTYSIGCINAISLILLLLCLCIFTPTFSSGFYSHEYDKYNIPSAIGVEKPHLMEVTRNLIDYMRGRVDTLGIDIPVNGVMRSFYNEKELLHMADVRGLFDIGKIIYKISVVVFLSTLAYIVCKKAFYEYAGSILSVTAVFLVLAVGLAVYIAIDFDTAFEQFHLIFFSNDLWQLDGTTDLLVNIVPQGFFSDIVQVVVIAFLTAMTTLVAVCAVHRKR